MRILVFLALIFALPVLAAGEAVPRRLMIHVSQNRDAEEGGQGNRPSGPVVLGSTRREGGNGQVWDTRSTRREGAIQRVQTIDGGRAYIQAGYSVPVPMRQVLVGPAGMVTSDAVVYRDIGQGFYAEPRLQGERVTVEISLQSDSPGRHGSVNSQRLSTTVSGRLGEWIELGSSGRRSAASTGSGWSHSAGEVQDGRSLWLMVEEIR